MQAALHDTIDKVPRLHRRLEHFFTKYPPQIYSTATTGITLPLTRNDARLRRIAEAERVQPPEEEQTGATPQSQQSELDVPTSLRKDRFPPNPFVPFRNPVNGHWSPPRIGLRIQADLFKLARTAKVEHLMPPSRKSTAFKEERTLKRGLRVKGTGIGQEVKGHKEERSHASLMERRKKALVEMPALVREWKRRGHGKSWRDWPKAKTR